MAVTEAPRVKDRDFTSEERWRAVLERDSSYDGAFVYAVRTTGIYCKPSCPSRRPNKKNVIFPPVAEIAESMGFRACQRCLPKLQPSDDPRLIMVRRACQLINDSLDGAPTLEELGDKLGVGPHHLQKVFKRIVGITPHQYSEAVRFGQLKSMLRDGWSVTNALYEAGYGSTSRLYERASSQFGMTPGDYRRGGESIEITYAITRCPAECSLGYLIVAATERGICAVKIGDDEAVLKKDLHNEFPHAQVSTGGSELEDWVGEIIHHLSGRQPHLDLPLDIRATAFERMVWEQLRRIPYGQTRTYSEIADAIGKPEATRAVANACAKNPTALVIPCHRVVRKDGSLGGYRWGIERKKLLLSQEQSTT